jgi:hypothetical protein
MAIGNAVQRGSTVYIYDEKDRPIGSVPGGSGPHDGPKGYTSSRVNVRRGSTISMYAAPSICMMKNCGRLARLQPRESHSEGGSDESKARRFQLDQCSGTEEPEWRLMPTSGSDTGIVIRDWNNAGLGFAVIQQGQLIAEGLQLRQALNLAISLFLRIILRETEQWLIGLAKLYNSDRPPNFPGERIDALREFLSMIRTKSDPAASLRQFFRQFGRLRSEIAPPSPPRSQLLPAHNILRAFFNEFSKLYQELLANGEFANPWTVAGLGRSELANGMVLAWLLNPQQTHGQGQRFLHELLSITKQIPVSLFPARYRVREEAYLLDDMETRVDIVIDGLPELVILIEIKIDAPERDDQISRNLSLAQRRANGRPNYMLSLSPSPPQVSDPRLFHITWQDVANAIFVVAHNRRNFADDLVLRFAKHVQQF